jgi:hypothetical protein
MAARLRYVSSEAIRSQYHAMVPPLLCTPLVSCRLLYPCNLSKVIKGGGFQVHLHNGEQQRVVIGGSAGTKRRAAVVLSDFGFKAKPGAPSPSGRSSSACTHPSWGVVERKAKRGRTLGRLVPQALRRGWSWTRSCLARLGNDGGMRTTEMTGIAKGAQ